MISNINTYQLSLVTDKGTMEPSRAGVRPMVRTEARTVRGTKADAMAAAEEWAGEGAKFFCRGARGDEIGYAGARGAVYVAAVSRADLESEY